MTRNHIHFAIGNYKFKYYAKIILAEPGNEVISGMR